MNIAICDDEKKMAELFSTKVMAENSGSNISIFTSGVDLIKSNMSFDVVFLDIEMETMDGFQVAKILNKNQPQCIFSFITTHAELAVDGYDYQPFRYILKTAPEPVIKRKIKETLNEYYRRNKTLKIAYKGNYCTVKVSDIFYIEITGHCMKLVLEKSEVLWSRRLNETEAELKSCGLVRCHRSFMVALPHISELTQYGVKLKNGASVPVGRKYKKYFTEAYNNFMLMG